MSQRAIDEERALRFGLWGELQANNGPDAVSPQRFRSFASTAGPGASGWTRQEPGTSRMMAQGSV